MGLPWPMVAGIAGDTKLGPPYKPAFITRPQAEIWLQRT